MATLKITIPYFSGITLNQINTTSLFHYTTLHCTALHCTALHCTALHCTNYHTKPNQTNRQHHTIQQVHKTAKREWKYNHIILYCTWLVHRSTPLPQHAKIKNTTQQNCCLWCRTMSWNSNASFLSWAASFSCSINCGKQENTGK